MLRLAQPNGRKGLTLHFDKLGFMSLSKEAALLTPIQKSGFTFDPSSGRGCAVEHIKSESFGKNVSHLFSLISMRNIVFKRTPIETRLQIEICIGSWEEKSLKNCIDLSRGFHCFLAILKCDDGPGGGGIKASRGAGNIDQRIPPPFSAS
jgi:hypothetical protein